MLAECISVVEPSSLGSHVEADTSSYWQDQVDIDAYLANGREDNPLADMCLDPKTLRLPHRVTIAVDSEFKDTHTLLVQCAGRIDSDTVAVQLYRSPLVPDLPADFDIQQYVGLTPEAYGPFCKRLILRPVKLLPSDLSPAGMALDLCGIVGPEVLLRSEGQEMAAAFTPRNAQEGDALPYKSELDPEAMAWWSRTKVTVVAHFLRADFCRIFGRQVFEDLKPAGDKESGDVVVRSRKLLQFIEKKGSWSNAQPVLSYSRGGPVICECSVETRDTMLPYGPASLDGLSKTFLKIGKSEVLSQEEKQDMLETFKKRPHDAYGYAVTDAVNTLLVYEQMQAKDRGIYGAFGFPETAIPELRPTLGSRVSNFLIGTTMMSVAAGSQNLGSRRQVEMLMTKGGLDLFQKHPDASRYGRQTGGTHGGLLYSRSPTRVWHESKGQLRDVDMSGCYNSIVSRMNVYWGRPVIFEPGNKALTLKDGVGFAKQHADEDGWMIRVSGDITNHPNAVILSTENAVTSLNYRQQLRPGKRRQTRRKVFRLEAVMDPCSKETKGSKLYSACVESGIVTQQTWLMIQALPEKLRQEYEELRVDSILLYPRKLVASSGVEYDKLVKEYRNESLPWESEIDMTGMELVKKERIDAEFVSLKYPIGHYAEQIGKYRKEAQKSEGKGSGADLAWKVHANAMYGILASRHLPTNNFVAANVVTAWARAEAFAMSQALNAIQTITDGCTYRLDQIPACTYRECLQLKADYPIHRADEGDGIPFVDPASIPGDDAGFTAWYREHVRKFFEVEGVEYDSFFSTHSLEHKKTGTLGTVAFDALACDGSGNYAKCVQDEQGQWKMEDFAARSYGRKSKEVLKAWVVETYRKDELKELSPVTQDTELLSYKKAGQKARKALNAGIPEVYFPLGLASNRVLNYRILKPSAFIFQNPEQRAAILKQWQKFEEKHGAGLELLALRRSYSGRKQGSVRDLAVAIYELIQQGDTSLKGLNVGRLPEKLVEMAEDRSEDIAAKKQEVERRMMGMIDTRKIDPQTLATAYVVRGEDLFEAEAGEE